MILSVGPKNQTPHVRKSRAGGRASILANAPRDRCVFVLLSFFRDHYDPQKTKKPQSRKSLRLARHKNPLTLPLHKITCRRRLVKVAGRLNNYGGLLSGEGGRPCSFAAPGSDKGYADDEGHNQYEEDANHRYHESEKAGRRRSNQLEGRHERVADSTG